MVNPTIVPATAPLEMRPEQRINAEFLMQPIFVVASRVCMANGES
jgi:hypothetical protein